ncbi:uncharacterized protein LOC107802048 [Nicotiana tabacum]|uniref:Uncharacterized protein LOC107802048 n=1 Tax=Nicotiana tabacum TaxID=4097 RepID=A0A1S4AWI9_TOBAC|nr:PREDICTED: uncharacterized protein LOC107802048 [Nicotiana tabacum]
MAEYMIKVFLKDNSESINLRARCLANLTESQKKQIQIHYPKSEEELLLDKNLWEREHYSFEEMRLKSLLQSKEEDLKWEKDLEAKKQREREIRFVLQREIRFELGDEVAKRVIDAFDKTIREFCSRPVTEEEKRLKQSELEHREKLAAQGRYLTGEYLTPCRFNPQFCHSHYFDSDVYLSSGFFGAPTFGVSLPGPGFSGAPTFGGSLPGPLPSQDFSDNAKLLMELANRAIEEYNEKECNAFKYKVLKIEKVNYSLSGTFDMYWMTVKVLNLTHGSSPVETFQIHAGSRCINHFDKKIYCCRPKEEAIAGLPSCEFCFRLLPERHATGGTEEAFEL